MLSMTGFGRSEVTEGPHTVTVEISGVNRKQVEIVPQVPRHLAGVFDPKIRQLLQNQISRGRVQVKVEVESSSLSGGPVLDREKARAYFAALGELEMLRGEPIQVTPSDLADFFHIESRASVDPELLWSISEKAIEMALEPFFAMRRTEGAHLKKDILERLALLAELVEKMSERAPSVVVRYRDSLRQRLMDSGLDLPLDDDRLVREIGIFAERCDISEELTRLRSHFDKFHEFLSSQVPVGRPLDFLCQETHREFNTIGSKANDAQLAQWVVAAKSELEKVREQIQNIE